MAKIVSTRGKYMSKTARKLDRQALSLNKIENKVFDKGIYKVTYKESVHSKLTKVFEGELIQQTKRFITLQNKRGIIESFLKVDFLIDSMIERVE